MWIEIMDIIGISIIPILFIFCIIGLIYCGIFLIRERELGYIIAGIYLFFLDSILIIIGLAVLEKIGII